jgi:hypothetical protein
MNRVLQAAFLVLALGVSSFGFQRDKGAISRPPRGNIGAFERLNKMSPEQRKRMLGRLPPDRRARIESQLDRYNSLPPEQRERLREQYEAFQELPPEKQEAYRKVFKRFSDLPADRRSAVRRVVERLRAMDDNTRGKRMSNQQFRERFSDSERELIEQMLKLPGNP